MKEIYYSDNQHREIFEETGRIVIQGDLEANTVKIKGELEVLGSMRVHGDCEIRGSLIVGNTLQCKKLVVDKNLQAKVVETEEIRIAGQIETESLRGKNITLRGRITISTEMQADEKIAITTGSLDFGRIKGIITSKTLRIVYKAPYSKWTDLPQRVYQIFGMKSRFKRDLYVSNLNVDCKELIFVVPYNIKRVQMIFEENCTIKTNDTQLESYYHN